MAKFNRNLSESAYAEVSELAGGLDITMAEVVREALHLLGWIAREINADNHLLIRRGDVVVELTVLELEMLRPKKWK